MARKTKDITITEPAGSRDLGKTFRIDEMDAEQGEEWAIRATLALTNAGVDMGEAQGFQGIAAAGLQGLSKLKFEDAKPLLEEMFTCISIVPDPKKSQAVARALRPDDIEEIATRLQLRAEVFKLHAWIFRGRKPIEGLDLGEPAAAFLTWPNLPASIGAVVTSKLATLHELQTIYGVEDLYKFLEIATVNAHNAHAAQKAQEKQ